MVTGDPPQETHMRRNLDAVMDGKHLLAIGVPFLSGMWLFAAAHATSVAVVMICLHSFTLGLLSVTQDLLRPLFQKASAILLTLSLVTLLMPQTCVTIKRCNYSRVAFLWALAIWCPETG